MTAHLASYKGTQPGLSGLFNRAIRHGSRSIYSHTEICIGNPFESEVMCVSASGVDGGVRSKMMRLSPEKWDIVPVPWVSDERVLNVLDDEGWCGYDYRGVARFAFPWLPDLLLMPSNEAWFCSELAAYIMGLDEPWRYAPAELHLIALAAMEWSNK